MSSGTTPLNYIKTQKIRYEWYVIRNFRRRIPLNHKKYCTDGMLSETFTLTFDQNTKNRVRIVCHQELSP